MNSKSSSASSRPSTLGGGGGGGGSDARAVGVFVFGRAEIGFGSDVGAANGELVEASVVATEAPFSCFSSTSSSHLTLDFCFLGLRGVDTVPPLSFGGRFFELLSLDAFTLVCRIVRACVRARERKRETFGEQQSNYLFFSS